MPPLGQAAGEIKSLYCCLIVAELYCTCNGAICVVHVYCDTISNFPICVC